MRQGLTSFQSGAQRIWNALPQHFQEAGSLSHFISILITVLVSRVTPIDILCCYNSSGIYTSTTLCQMCFIRVKTYYERLVNNFSKLMLFVTNIRFKCIKLTIKKASIVLFTPYIPP